MSLRSKREYQTAIRTNIFNFESSSEKSKAFTAETPRRGEIITSPWVLKNLKFSAPPRLVCFSQALFKRGNASE